MIEGVRVIELKKIPDERGCIYHMLKSTDEHFSNFGEIYFSTAYPGVIKGWHIHEEMTLNYSVVKGMIKLVLYDMRKDSKTYHELMEIFVGDRNYKLIQIPPGVANGFKCIGNEECIVANCATIPHNPSEIKRIPPFSKEIPYDWDLVMT